MRPLVIQTTGGIVFETNGTRILVTVTIRSNDAGFALMAVLLEYHEGGESAKFPDSCSSTSGFRLQKADRLMSSQSVASAKWIKLSLLGEDQQSLVGGGW